MPDAVDRLTDQAIGSRVVVRVRVGDGPTMRDVLGELITLAPVLRVRRDDGSLARLDVASVVAAKPVPPRPARRPSYAAMLALEETAAKSWQAPDSEWLGRWLLRAADGFTGRANSALPLGDPGCGTDEALARVVDWYARRGLPAMMQVPLPVRHDLDDELTRRGWTVGHGALVLVSDLLPGRLTDQPARADLPPVELLPAPDDDWLAGYHYRGGAGLPGVARPLLMSGDRRAFACVRDAGQVLAIGRVVADDGWSGVTAVEVGPAHRRRGLGRHVMAALRSWALAQGAERMWLQVAPDNAGARALYGRLGFTEHHRYGYRVAPDNSGQRRNSRVTQPVR